MRRGRSSLLLLLALGCSSSTTDPEPDETAPDTTVYDSCVAFAERLCESAQGCCEQAYGAYDAAGCLATFRRDVCRPGADAVAAGRATFDANAIENCLAAHAEAHAICKPTWSQTLELRRQIYADCRVIDGKTKPGLSCSVAATCKHPDGAATADCIKNVCTVIELLPEGAECPFPTGPVSVCDAGLTCDAPGLGGSGHCVPAVPTNQACDGSVLEGIDCGLGSYCDPEASVCKSAENRGGEGCRQSTECVSFDCDRSRHECADAPAVVARDTCLGPETAPSP
jgi:hypothetical protein